MDNKALQTTTDVCTHDVHALCVSRVPIFNHLPSTELRHLASKSTMKSYGRGQFIHRSGDLAEQLFIVHKGKVKVYRLSEAGKEQLVRILMPGDFAGELALFSTQEHDSYAEAMVTSEICTIAKTDVHDLLLSYPAIGLHILAEVARRLAISEKQTAVIANEPINSRIALYLADLAEQANATSFSLPMSRRNIASFLGTTPETISRRLSEFEASGWIQQTGQRQITILDLDALLLL